MPTTQTQSEMLAERLCLRGAARPGPAYFEAWNEPQAGTVIDISKGNYLGKFMSPATKIDLMEYGLGQLG